MLPTSNDTEDNVDSRIKGLLEYLSAAVIEIAENPRLPLVRLVIEGLERLGAGDDASSRLIRRYAFELRGDVLHRMGRLDEAIDTYQSALDLLDGSRLAHWVNTSAIVRILCEQGKVREAFDLIGRTILDSLNYGPGETQWIEYFRTAASCPIESAVTSDLFKEAASLYADRFLTIPGSDLIREFHQNPANALEILLGSGTGAG